MRFKISFVLVSAVSLIFLSMGLNFAQEQPAAESLTEPEIQWLWGDVVSVDVQKNELVVKYLDYEIDQEKQMTINVDEKTTYESVKSLDEIKPLDTVSVDYIVSTDGKNIAKNISIEKPEALPTQPETAPAPTEESPAQEPKATPETE